MLIHLFADRLKMLHGLPRSSWLSLAGGMSVAYVFVHLLPELSEAQDAIAEEAEGLFGTAETHVYVIALVGLVVFYGLERTHARSRRAAADKDLDQRTFWVSIGSYGLYNLLVGYLLLHRYREGTGELVLFSLAMALHFLVTDYGLREHHKDRYVTTGRWVLCAALLAGMGVGVAAQVSAAAVGVVIAFLGGGIILNVMAEELPSERESRFSAFALGAVLYSAILLAL